MGKTAKLWPTEPDYTPLPGERRTAGGLYASMSPATKEAHRASNRAWTKQDLAENWDKWEVTGCDGNKYFELHPKGTSPSPETGPYAAQYRKLTAKEAHHAEGT